MFVLALEKLQECYQQHSQNAETFDCHVCCTCNATSMLAYGCRSRSREKHRSRSRSRSRNRNKDSKSSRRERSRSRSNSREAKRPRPGAAAAAAAERSGHGSNGQASLAVGRQQHGEPQLGAVYRGKVNGIMEFGCFVELQDFNHLGKKVGGFILAGSTLIQAIVPQYKAHIRQGEHAWCP